MTALDRYIRLEATGQWRERQDAPGREVLVSFGNATLIISDFDEAPLTHWALAAVTHVAEGPPALYAPGGDGTETLEISDPQMIEAIAEVARAARAAAPIPPHRRGWLARRWPVIVALALVFVLAATQGPDLLRQRALALISPTQAELISTRLLDRLPARCNTLQGDAAIARFTAPLGLDRPAQALAWEFPPATRLPDGTILVAGLYLAGEPEAARAYGSIVAAASAPSPALNGWIADLPLGDLLRFLMTGTLRDTDYQSMITALAHPTAPAPPSPDVPKMTDQDWIALTQICQD